MKQQNYQHIFKWVLTGVVLFVLVQTVPAINAQSGSIQPLSTQNSVAALQSSGVSIIAHPSVPIEALSRQELLELYTLETNKWEDGSLVILFDQKPNTTSKQIFYEHLKQHQRDLKKIWMRVVLSGEGRTPRIVKSEEEVVKKVSETPGSIGYVQQALVIDGVKVLDIIMGEDVIVKRDIGN